MSESYNVYNLTSGNISLNLNSPLPEGGYLDISSHKRRKLIRSKRHSILIPAGSIPADLIKITGLTSEQLKDSVELNRLVKLSHVRIEHIKIEDSSEEKLEDSSEEKLEDSSEEKLEDSSEEKPAVFELKPESKPKKIKQKKVKAKKKSNK